MLRYIIEQTERFIEAIPKTSRKKIGQFFTYYETAEFMASLFDLSGLGSEISILDPGAGTGILSAALIQKLQETKKFSHIRLTCFENDTKVIPVLKSNLEYIKKNINASFDFIIHEDNYILNQSADFNYGLYSNANAEKYDLIISNPPYLKIPKNSPESLAMDNVVHGAPNMYFLFAAMSLFNLKDNCEMVYIMPRSWTSGQYFKVFREYIFKHGQIKHIHLFESRSKVFRQEQVLQETAIIKIKKCTEKSNISITSSSAGKDFSSLSKISMPYASIVSGEELYVLLPTNSNDLEIMRRINVYKQTMPEIGFRMRTGIIVDFRQYDNLRKNADKNNVPLFYSQHIKNGRVNHLPSGKEFDWVSDENPGIIQENKNYVFCKRFTAKEEKRRLQCGIYLSSDFPEYEKIGTQNKINFVEREDGKSLTVYETYGIYALLNSSLFDSYYRILNGSTQVNSTEINSIPVPPIKTITDIGKMLIDSENLSTENCDKILRETAYG